MFKAPTGAALACPVEGVDASLPDWYNSVVLFKGGDKKTLKRRRKSSLKMAYVF